MKQRFFLVIVMIITSFDVIFSQKTNEFGLYVIGDIQQYHKLIEKDSSKALVDIEKKIPGIKLEIKYATNDNFLGKKVYNFAKAYLRREAADSLQKVQKELKSMGLGLKIFDSYRPYDVTIQFYNEYEDTTFVASPWRGSRHNRGCAVDLTLIDLKSNKEIEMPTPYDDFTEKAYVNFMGLEDNQIKNRDLLINVMQSHGFIVYEYEWWHFDFKNWKNFELMNLSFEELQNIN